MPDRVEYRIAREPAGERYRSLIDAGLRHGETLLLIVRNRIGVEAKLTTDGSRVPAWVIPTNEELLIARDTLRAILELPMP